MLAQQLLFGSTADGDLTKLLNGYFDTAVGPKQAPDSYRAIAERIRARPQEMLFVSDVVEELDAARAGGVRTVLCVRGDGAAPPGRDSHPVVSSFDEIVD